MIGKLIEKQMRQRWHLAVISPSWMTAGSGHYSLINDTHRVDGDFLELCRKSERNLLPVLTFMRHTEAFQNFPRTFLHYAPRTSYPSGR